MYTTVREPIGHTRTLGERNRPFGPEGSAPQSRGLDLVGARLALGRAWPARARKKSFC